MSTPQLVELEVEVKAKRAGALLIAYAGGERARWVPLAVVDAEGSDVADVGDCGRLLVALEWARREKIA